jgi:hypothetical protein
MFHFTGSAGYMESFVCLVLLPVREMFEVFRNSITDSVFSLESHATSIKIPYRLETFENFVGHKI